MDTDAPSGSGRSDKQRRRSEARARRAALDPGSRAEWSAEVAEQVGALLPASGPVMTYVAIRDELDLGALNARLVRERRLVLPRVEGRRLAPVPWDGGEALVESRFGVPEPAGAEIDPSVLVAVVVPALAIDPAGHRIGYGAGFYDRFLPTLPTDCLVVGVCFAAQRIDDAGPEPHDVALAVVVTERPDHGRHPPAAGHR